MKKYFSSGFFLSSRESCQLSNATNQSFWECLSKKLSYKWKVGHFLYHFEISPVDSWSETVRCVRGYTRGRWWQSCRRISWWRAVSDVMEYIMARPGLWQNRSIFDESFGTRKHLYRPIQSFILHRRTVPWACTCILKGFFQTQFINIFLHWWNFMKIVFEKVVK